jgi:hypothetical protein
VPISADNTTYTTQGTPEVLVAKGTHTGVALGPVLARKAN